MQRRELLRYGVATVAGATAGGTIIAQTTDTASASASVAMGTLAVADASTTTDDGTVGNVAVQIDGQWQYDLPGGKSPDSWTVTLGITDGEQTATVDETGGNAKYLQNSGSYSLQGSITKTDLYDASDFAAPENKTRELTLGVFIAFTVLDGDGEALAAATLTDTGTVAVTNEGYVATEYGSVSGEGALTVE